MDGSVAETVCLCVSWVSCSVCVCIMEVSVALWVCVTCLHLYRGRRVLDWAHIDTLGTSLYAVVGFVQEYM